MDQRSLNLRQISLDQWPGLSLFCFVDDCSSSSIIVAVLFPRLATEQHFFLHFLPSISQLLPTKNFFCYVSCQNEILSCCHFHVWCHGGKTDFQLLHCLGRRKDQANGHLMSSSQQMLMCPEITWHKHSFNE